MGTVPFTRINLSHFSIKNLSWKHVKHQIIIQLKSILSHFCHHKAFQTKKIFCITKKGGNPTELYSFFSLPTKHQELKFKSWTRFSDILILQSLGWKWQYLYQNNLLISFLPTCYLEFWADLYFCLLSCLQQYITRDVQFCLTGNFLLGALKKECFVCRILSLGMNVKT